MKRKSILFGVTIASSIALCGAAVGLSVSTHINYVKGGENPIYTTTIEGEPDGVNKESQPYYLTDQDSNQIVVSSTATETAGEGEVAKLAKGQSVENITPFANINKVQVTYTVNGKTLEKDVNGLTMTVGYYKDNTEKEVLYSEHDFSAEWGFPDSDANGVKPSFLKFTAKEDKTVITKILVTYNCGNRGHLTDSLNNGYFLVGAGSFVHFGKDGEWNQIGGIKLKEKNGEYYVENLPLKKGDLIRFNCNKIGDDRYVTSTAEGPVKNEGAISQENGDKNIVVNCDMLASLYYKPNKNSVYINYVDRDAALANFNWAVVGSAKGPWGIKDEFLLTSKVIDNVAHFVGDFDFVKDELFKIKGFDIWTNNLISASSSTNITKLDDGNLKVTVAGNYHVDFTPFMDGWPIVVTENVTTK